MADETKPELEIVHPTPEVLDEEEPEFRVLRRDLPGVKGASAAGIVSIGVGKIPGKNEFFRTHPEFRPTVPMVDVEVGMEKQYFAGKDDRGGALRWHRYQRYRSHAVSDGNLAPVRFGSSRFGNQQLYGQITTMRAPKEIGLIRGVDTLGSALHRSGEQCTTRFLRRPPTALPNRSGRRWSHAKIFRLAFRDKGRLIRQPRASAVSRGGPARDQ